MWLRRLIERMCGCAGLGMEMASVGGTTAGKPVKAMMLDEIEDHNNIQQVTPGPSAFDRFLVALQSSGSGREERQYNEVNMTLHKVICTCTLYICMVECACVVDSSDEIHGRIKCHRPELCWVITEICAVK